MLSYSLFYNKTVISFNKKINKKKKEMRKRVAR